MRELVLCPCLLAGFVRKSNANPNLYRHGVDLGSTLSFAITRIVLMFVVKVRGSYVEESYEGYCEARRIWSRRSPRRWSWNRAGERADPMHDRPLGQDNLQGCGFRSKDHIHHRERSLEANHEALAFTAAHFRAGIWMQAWCGEGG